MHLIGNRWGIMAKDGNFCAKFHFSWHSNYLPYEFTWKKALSSAATCRQYLMDSDQCISRTDSKSSSSMPVIQFQDSHLTIWYLFPLRRCTWPLECYKWHNPHFPPKWEGKYHKGSVRYICEEGIWFLDVLHGVRTLHPSKGFDTQGGKGWTGTRSDDHYFAEPSVY